MIQLVRVCFAVFFIALLCANIEARAKNPPLRFPLPGESAANLVLQKDVLPGVLAVATTGHPCCKTPFVSNTHVVQQPEQAQNGRLLSGEWTESWTVNACGDSVHVPVRFTAGGKGSPNYVVSAPKNQ